MEVGISNKITLSFFAESADDDVKKIFIGVFPANFVNRFISFHNMISESIPKYPFVIMNTDRSDKKGTNWYSFFDLHPKKEIFTFDSLVSEVLRNSLYKMTRSSSIRYFMVLKSLIKRTIKSL